MRKFLLFILPLLILCGCAEDAPPDYLAYQNQALTIEADFTLDDEAFPGTLTLATAEYDEAGRMLARDASLTLGGNSIISGVTFELTGGEAYISSGVLKIPLADESVIAGIRDLVSLFCIDPAAYYSAEEGDLTRVTYTDGDNRVIILWNPETELPTNITADIDGKTISAENIQITASA